MANPLVRIKVDMTPVRASLRGLSSDKRVGLDKMDKGAAEVMVKHLQKEVPRGKTNRLYRSIKSKKGTKGHWVQIGDTQATYSKPVMAWEKSSGRKTFIARAMINSRSSRRKVYETGIKAAIARLRLGRR